MSSYLDGLLRYFDFGGRSTRLQFWAYLLTLFFLNVVIYVLMRALGINAAPTAEIVFGIFWVLHTVPTFAVLARRLHDSGLSMKWIALAIILPIVGWAVVLIMACRPSDEDENDYGPGPEDSLEITHFDEGRSEPRADHDYDAATPKPRRDPPVYGVTASASEFPLDEMERLQSLRNENVIDDTEFAAMKVKLLERFTEYDARDKITLR